MPHLVGSDGERYFSWELTPGTHVVGRKQDVDFCIPNSTVSRRHASIEVSPDDGTIRITDLGSHNGTLINSVRIEKAATAHVGDALVFGQVEFRILDEQEPPLPESVRTLSDQAGAGLEKSVVLSIAEALKPLPAKVSDIPEVMTSLSEMARMLVLPEPREIMLKRSLELVEKVIPAERLAILFTADDGESVSCAASVERGGRDHGDFSLSRTLINDILTNKNAILIEDSQRDSRYARQESVIISGMKSAMAVPLFDEGKVLGILYADTTNPLHRYTDEYLRLAATFGNIIASRLLNYELWNEREERKIIQAELKRAAQIQENLLVKTMPVVSGYQIHAFQQQSREVGGDLYDLHVLSDGRLVFMVADVSGKGMGAALLMSNILASFRIMYDSGDFRLLRAVELVSRQLCAHSGSLDFATLFIGILDPAAHSITYVNAGHPSPMVVDRAGGITELESSGMMIGAFAQCEWQEQTIALEPGSLLFVFSDGVTEAQCGEELYDERRMAPQVVTCSTFPPEEMVSRLMRDIADFADDVAGADDITMLVIKRAS
jgi:serine phosphatase RsbU (regulator of sigma subunit)/pSer/pThr/pTyr-binding forkhead associated (FHA) protein